MLKDVKRNTFHALFSPHAVSLLTVVHLQVETATNASVIHRSPTSSRSLVYSVAENS